MLMQDLVDEHPSSPTTANATIAKTATVNDDVISVSAAVVHTAWRRSHARRQRRDDDDNDDDDKRQLPVAAADKATTAAVGARDMQHNQYRQYPSNRI